MKIKRKQKEKKGERRKSEREMTLKIGGFQMQCRHLQICNCLSKEWLCPETTQKKKKKNNSK